MTTPNLAAACSELKDPRWPQIRRHFEDWWQRRGPVVWINAPRSKPLWDCPPPPPTSDLFERWFSPEYRLRQEEHRYATTYCGGDAFPIYNAISAAGDLALYLGSEATPEAHTVWVEPCIGEPPQDHPRIALDRNSRYFQLHTRMVEIAVRESGGRWLTMMPDLVENIDILSSMRGTQLLMMDMLDQPQWVEQRVQEINQAYFEVFEHFYQLSRDAHGGNVFVFSVWGPGRTAKVQCDACSMFGPDMFRQFVSPALTEQCRWLDYAMYHLDGPQCLPNLDALLEIEPLRAVEWTPLGVSQGQGGGKREHFDIYRRILAAGKSVQAICVQPDEVIPMLDELGPAGMYISCYAGSEDEARRLEERIRPYYPG